MSANELVVRPAELSGLFDPRSSGSLTGSEREMLSALLSNDERMDIAIPTSIESDDLWRALELCCKVQVRVRRVGSVLKMLVGRALILMDSRPELYKTRGFISLDALMSDEGRGLPAMTGISRGELYNAKKIAAAFPGMTSAEYSQVGFSKLLDLSKIVKGSDSNAQEWIDAAKTGTQQELREKIYASENGIEPGSLETVTLSFIMTGAERDRIMAFVNDPDIQGFCGTALTGVILNRVIEETEIEWRVRIRASEERS